MTMSAAPANASNRARSPSAAGSSTVLPLFALCTAKAMLVPAKRGAV